MMLIGHVHFYQFMESHVLDITTFKPVIFASNVCLKAPKKPNNYQFYLPNFLKFFDNFSHK